MTLPTLHLTNAASRSQHGPGRLFAAMAKPPRWMLEPGADGRRAIQGLSYCHASSEQLRVVQAERSRRAAVRYYRQCRHLAAAQLLAGRLRPVQGPRDTLGLTVALRPGAATSTVQDGDTLVCTCARPDTGKRPAWQPFCHLEVWAAFLAAAGWRVILYGRALVCVDGEVRWEDSGELYRGLWVARAPLALEAT